MWRATRGPVGMIAAWGSRFATRRYCAGHTSAAPEVITLDDIEIEVAWTTADGDGNAHGGGGGSSHHAPMDDTGFASHNNDGRHAAAGEHADSQHQQHQHHHHQHRTPTTPVTTIDTFSKSKVLNYLKRVAKERGDRFDSAHAFEVEQDGDHYRCRIRLYCPHPHGVKVGEGEATNVKDAEMLAAMHAERVLDALGIPLYVLPSMQQKHAEAARRTGRWAPMPSDPIRPVDTSIPPPLSMLGLGSGNLATAVPSASSDGNGATTTNTGAATFQDGMESIPGAPTAASVGASSVFYLDAAAHAAEAYDRGQGVSATDSAVAAMYDHMEGNSFQPCNLVSTRFSHTDVAITLPLVYDKGARARVAAYLKHHNLQELERAARVTHVAVQGMSYRMHLAEFKITADGSLIARGKALDKQQALDLAAMHAELLLDFHGIPLFPQDPEKQKAHAAVAVGCGRWAPQQAGDVPPHPKHLAPPAIKQLIGPAQDQEGLSGFTKGAHYTERILMVHHELSNQWNQTFIEACPTEETCAEARRLVRGWLESVGCKYADAYVCTRMGDFVRASIVLPLPGEYGVRGGNSIGRSAAQAIDLAALNALDVLCALGINVHGDDVEARRKFVERRQQQGLVCPPDLESGGEPRDPRTWAPPGYHVEGPVRPLPSHADVMHCLQIPDDTYKIMAGTPENIIERGNQQKPHVQAYLRLATGGTDRLPVVIQTGSSPSVRNVVFLPIPLPEETHGPNQRVMAVGYALKKKDAERACFMHAWDLLEANGIPIHVQRDTEMRVLRERKKGLKANSTNKPAPKPAPAPTAETPATPAEASVSASGPETSATPPGEASQKASSPVYAEVKLTPPLMHPALDQLLRREAEILAAKRARPKLFSDRD